MEGENPEREESKMDSEPQEQNKDRYDLHYGSPFYQIDNEERRTSEDNKKLSQIA